jgi:hypothetical protein
MHPETKDGGDHGNQHTGGKATRQNGDLADRFTKDTADKTGMSERTRAIFITKELIMIQDSPAVFDRGPQLQTLDFDIQIATTHAEQHGIPLQDIVLQLLQRADDLCRLGNERGSDLSRVGDIFRGDGE